MNAFLTGSRAYGTPHEKSDIDLVVLVSHDDMQELMELAPYCDGENEYDGGSGENLRFGKLNLLCFTDPAFFGAWKDATDELIARKPVTREQAVEAITAKVEVVQNAMWAAEGEHLAQIDAIGSTFGSES